MKSHKSRHAAKNIKQTRNNTASALCREIRCSLNTAMSTEKSSKSKFTQEQLPSIYLDARCNLK